MSQNMISGMPSKFQLLHLHYECYLLPFSCRFSSFCIALILAQSDSLNSASNQSSLLYGDPNSHQWSPFEKIFPEKLREPFESKCGSISDEGEKGICELLAATDLQASLAGNITSPQEQSHEDEASSVDSCSYRKEGGPDLHVHASMQTPQLQALLRSYIKMHRLCVSAEYSNIKNIYEGRISPKCRYIIWSCTFGLGNKFMSLISTFLYAMLSQRVLLIESDEWKSLFCEPFLGSSVMAPKSFSLKDDKPPSFVKFYDRDCDSGMTQKRHRQLICNATALSVVFSGTTKASEHRFLVCPSAIASVRNVAILDFRNSNQHFAVGFFLNPALRPVLEILFPEHNIFHHLSRFLLNPADSVWEKVRSLHSAHFFNSSRRIGIQLREFKGEYRDYYDTTAPLCIKSKSGLCPFELAEAAKQRMKQLDPSSPAPKSNDYISVYVSSLAGGHFTQLNKSMAEIERQTGQQYKIFAQEADGDQLEDVGHLQKALLDIWLLSLSDVLMTSHMSTFGYTAQGLAGITPYHLKPWRDNPCWLSVSSDPCFHFGPKSVRCKKDMFVMRNAVREVEYVSSCPDLPDTELQLAQ